MSAKIAFLSRKPEANERKPVAAVRPAAIAKRDGRDVVYVVRGANGGKGAGAPTAGGPAEAKGETKGAAGGGRVSVTPVSVGAAVGELVRVEGVAPGTRVIIAPPAKLDEGVVVSAAKK